MDNDKNGNMNNSIRDIDMSTINRISAPLYDSYHPRTQMDNQRFLINRDVHTAVTSSSTASSSSSSISLSNSNISSSSSSNSNNANNNNNIRLTVHDERANIKRNPASNGSDILGQLPYPQSILFPSSSSTATSSSTSVSNPGGVVGTGISLESSVLSIPNIGPSSSSTFNSNINNNKSLTSSIIDNSMFTSQTLNQGPSVMDNDIQRSMLVYDSGLRTDALNQGNFMMNLISENSSTTKHNRMQGQQHQNKRGLSTITTRTTSISSSNSSSSATNTSPLNSSIPPEGQQSTTTSSLSSSKPLSNDALSFYQTYLLQQQQQQQQQQSIASNNDNLLQLHRHFEMLKQAQLRDLSDRAKFADDHFGSSNANNANNNSRQRIEHQSIHRDLHNRSFNTSNPAPNIDVFHHLSSSVPTASASTSSFSLQRLNPIVATSIMNQQNSTLPLLNQPRLSLQLGVQFNPFESHDLVQSYELSPINQPIPSTSLFDAHSNLHNSTKWDGITTTTTPSSLSSAAAAATTRLKRDRSVGSSHTINSNINIDDDRRFQSLFSESNDMKSPTLPATNIDIPVSSTTHKKSRRNVKSTPIQNVTESNDLAAIINVPSDPTNGIIDSSLQPFPNDFQQGSIPRFWTQEEDDALVSAVKIHGPRKWKQISMMVSGRNPTQCQQRWSKVLVPGLRKGPWSKEEDALLLKLTQAQIQQSQKRLSLVNSLTPSASISSILAPPSSSMTPNASMTSQIDNSLSSPSSDGKMGGGSSSSMTYENSTKINWRQISESIPGRTAKQCRARWVNNLNPELKKEKWSQEEDDTIMRLYGVVGSKWSYIASKLDGRSENAVKIRYISLSRIPKNQSGGISSSNSNNNISKGNKSNDETEDENNDEDFIA